MLRPGWFIEYSPKEQKIFDILHTTIEQTFQQYGYQHIHTPAVEKVDTLKKGWDEVSKQIFGLYGLAQWSEDTKDYALHFDLTVPFARYVLDRQNDLAFPFKRYQIQPVWRGERSQKGRYKEFRQADIDVIWKTEDDKGYNAIYDADCVLTLAKTMRTGLNNLWLQDKHLVVRYNNKAFMQAVCDRLEIGNTTELFALLDKYYKLPKDMFDQKLTDLIGAEKFEALQSIRDIENTIEQFPERETYMMPFINNLKPYLSSLQWIEIVYDPSIVRGLDYYTGTVFETFIEDRKDLGSICSWWSYANLTEFMDTKQSFSWVGGSIGLSRLMSVLLEEYNIAETYKSPGISYLILHEEKSRDKAQELVSKLRKQWYIAEIYPTAEKTDKQFKYAEKKWVSHVIQFFDDIPKVKPLWWQREDLSVD